MLKFVQYNLIGEESTIICINIFQNIGIQHHISCPHTQQQNGLAERKHRHLVETGLTLLAQANMPLHFWDEAFNTACYLINRMPSRTIQNDTPIHKLLKTQPDYSMLKVFSCACWPNLRAYIDRKLNFRTKQCIFLGYSSSHKGYKCLDRSTGRIYLFRDVVFDESVFPYTLPVSTDQALQHSNHPTILPTLAKPTFYTEDALLLHHHSAPPNPLPSPAGPAIDDVHMSNEQTNSVVDAGSSNIDEESPVAAQSSSSVQDGSVSEREISPEPPEPEPEPVIRQQRQMNTRLRKNIVQPKEFTDGTVRYSVHARSFVPDGNPTTTTLSADRVFRTELS